MRSEKEMLALITGFARKDRRVLAAWMNGSRANPRAPADEYRDYDIVYAVEETASFINSREWLKAFGIPLLVQEPDKNDAELGMPTDTSLSYTWLMLFEDGSRIDLSIKTKEKALEAYVSDSLTVPLLDKCGLLPEIPAASDRDYHVQMPTQGSFAGCCNEFWWCMNNVAKGLARGEMPYAADMYNLYVHPMLAQMTEWYIGAENNFSVSVGKHGKYFEKYLKKELYAAYISTYSAAEAQALAQVVRSSCRLFGSLARQTAQALGFEYNASEESGLLRYLEMTVKFD